MITFKRLYLEAIREDTVNEGLGDLLGDIKDAAGKAIKAGASKAFSQGTKDVAARLFNVENDIMRLLDLGEYRALGKLLIDKKIPQNFVFKRISLFGKNTEFGATVKTYRNVPLFFAITAKLIDKGQAANLLKIYAQIASAGIQIKTFLNRVDEQHKDVVSFILLAPNKPNIAQTGKPATGYEKICQSVIKALLTYGYDSAVTDNLSVNTAIRMESLNILKAFFDGKYKVKFTTEIEQEADQVDNAEIIAYIESVKIGKVAGPAPGAPTVPHTGSTPASKLDFTKYGYDPKIPSKQKLQHAAALVLAKDLAKEAGKPLDAAKIKTLSNNKMNLQASLGATLQKLGMPRDIVIV